MSVPTGLPAPRTNQTQAGLTGAAKSVVVADIAVAVGDYTAGAAEDMFTLSAHGLTSGDYVFLLYKDAMGVVTGRVGTKFRVKVLTSSTFQLLTLAGVIVENTADGTAVLLRASHATPDTVVQTVILDALIVALGDFTGGTTEDEFIARPTGLHGLEETDTLRLLYKAAAGVVTGISAGTTVFAKSVRPDAFELAATSGGADIENSADGLAIFLKTS